MSAWQKISTKDHFPTVDVFERQGPLGRVFRITFWNLEREDSKARKAVSIGGIFFLLLAPWAAWPVFGAQAAGASMTLAVTLGLPIWIILWKDPKRKHRAIELDFNNDQLRVYRRERSAKQEKLIGHRKLSRLADISIGPHPEVEAERAQRARNNQSGPGPRERTQCLFGHFGEGGAEKIWLIQREEWPNRDSLYEVQQAIAWAFNQGAKEVKAQQAAQDAPAAEFPAPDAAPEPAPKKGIKPPLD